MAEGKKSIIVYADWIKKFEKLTDEEAGRLIKHFFRYVNDENPIAPDRITELSFIDIEQSLKRDLIKWEKRAQRSRENGKNGGRPIVNENPGKPEITKQVILKPKKPDSVSVNVSVTDSVNVIKENIDTRKLKFSDTLKPFLQKYGKDMLNEFYKYWTETNRSGTKFRQEFQKTWSIERRLETWAKNEKKPFDKQNQQQASKSFTITGKPE